MWTYNSIRIFVQEHTGDGSQIIPRLQPLSNRTITQFFGYEDMVHTINAYVIGDTDLAGLRALRKTATAYELMSPEGDLGDFYLKKVSFKRVPNICQTLRTDLAEDAPMYLVDLELYPTADE